MRKLSRLLIIVLLLSLFGAANPGSSTTIPTAKAAVPRLVIIEEYFSLI